MGAAKRETKPQHTPGWVPPSGDEVEVYPGYVVTRGGTVWSVAQNWRGLGKRPLASHPDDDGYPVVRIQVDGRRRKFRVHRLVAEAFLGPKTFAWDEIRHLDGDPTNNDASNLAYGTSAENAADRERHGRTSRGLTHSMKVRRLAEANARLIAAAPELLVLLERYVASDVECDTESTLTVEARAAISKARGKS